MEKFRERNMDLWLTKYVRTTLGDIKIILVGIGIHHGLGVNLYIFAHGQRISQDTRGGTMVYALCGRYCFDCMAKTELNSSLEI